MILFRSGGFENKRKGDRQQKINHQYILASNSTYLNSFDFVAEYIRIHNKSFFFLMKQTEIQT